MATLEFLDEIPINKAYALEQLLGRLQTVHDGLPELVKNSKDQYARLGITDRVDRVIVVIANSELRRVGVLDFGGATSEDFRHWKTWADPYANRANVAHDIEGGHGNGGKGFMVRGSSDDSFFESCRDGLRTKMGYSNTVEGKQYYPAFFAESGKRLDAVKVKSPRKQLDLALEALGVTFSALPASAQRAFDTRQAYSLVQVNGVKDWSGRASTVRHQTRDLPEELVQHAQAALTIESCSVYVVVDGKALAATPLECAELEPMPGFENLPPIPVPDKLPDPRTTELVSTGTPGGTLQLKTSAQPLRMPNRKPLNVVRVRNTRNVVGNWSVADLHSLPSSTFICGTLLVPSLGPEHQVGADRVVLADTPLVRALEAWTAAQVAELASRIQKALAKEHKPQEIEKATDGLRQMREAMREFLSDLTKGRGGKGGDDGTGGPPTPPPGKVVRQIVLEGGAQAIALASGTSVPLLLRAYDLSPEGQKLLVRRPQLELRSDPGGLVALVDKGTLHADAAGRTTIWFQDPTSGIESNRVEVEVIRATGAEFKEIPSRLLLQGESVPLRVVFKTERGSRGDVLVEARADLLVDAEVDEPLMGVIDRYGVFTAGGHEGTATVRVRYGAASSETSASTLQIGPDRVKKPTPKKGGDDGADVPLILLCGQEAPNREDLPIDQRTQPPSELLPTVIDYDPLWEPIIFINQGSREATQVRSGRRGRGGVAPIGSEPFLQFLAIKCFEILKRLYVKQSLAGDKIGELDFRQRFAEAETLCAPFVDRAFDIARQMTASVREDG